nr:hypothetical protein [Tanacetum cinerariifolium]
MSTNVASSNLEAQATRIKMSTNVAASNSEAHAAETQATGINKSSQLSSLLFFDQLDVDGDIIHCIAKGTVAHNFLHLKEGGIYSIKNFALHPNKNDFRIVKHATFMLKFDGSTTIRKTHASDVGFLRYPFQLVAFDRTEPTNNKYMIDKLYLSRSSSTAIYDDENIPCLQELITDGSAVESSRTGVPVEFTQPKEGTLENVLIWAKN